MKRATLQLKRKMLATLLLLAICIACNNDAWAQRTAKMGKHIPVIEQFIRQQFAKGAVPPFSFIYDGKPSKNFIRKWNYTATKLEGHEADVIKYRFTYTDPNSRLQAECLVTGYPSYDAAEWVLHFTNEGQTDSPLLKQVKVIDLTMCYPTQGNFTLHYAEGNHISKADFHPRSLPLALNQPKEMAPTGGRSSEGDYLPFFNIESPAGQGVFLSIGWSGTWYADVCQTAANSVSLASGMKTCELYLHKGESIRTPSVSLMFWQSNNRIDGHNKFRRLVLAHKTRKINGRIAEYPLSSGFNYRDPAPCTEYSCLTADYAIAMVKRYIQFGLKPQVFWLDAGWNTGASDYENGKSWANTVGNWTVDTLRFPEGLRPVADEIHKVGAKFMVWFEPERVIRGTQWAVEHPEWMLDIPEHNKDTYLLFDLGNPKACEWLSRYIGDMLEENAIDYYRQDFNMHPDIYWAANDEPHRAGMKEIRHIEGLYRFWDYLLKRFPNLLIDNCASGGKRLDWETIGRSAPLWRSDYYHYDDPDGYQCHTYGLNFFLPLHGTGSLQTEPYSFRSSMSTALIYNWKITDKQSSVPEMRRCLKEFHYIRPYYYEDYYPLTGIEDITRNNIWLAYQMHRPSDDSGIVMAFRRKDAKENEITVCLSAVKSTQNYTVKDLDTGIETFYTGKQLANGLQLVISKPHGSLLLKYQPTNTKTEEK